MAVVQTKRQRDPDSPVQHLRTKKHGNVRVNGKFWVVGPGVGKIIVQTPEGGYRYARGGPIRSKADLELLPKGPDRERALEWWANKDKWQDTAPRKIAFEPGTGYPMYEDTGEYVETMDVLQAYWPDGPVLFAATCALGDRLKAKVGQREPQVDTRVAQGCGAGPSPSPPPAGMIVAAPSPGPVIAATPSTKGPGGGKPLTRTQLSQRREKLAATRAAKETKAAMVTE